MVCIISRSYKRQYREDKPGHCLRGLYSDPQAVGPRSLCSVRNDSFRSNGARTEVDEDTGRRQGSGKGEAVGVQRVGGDQNATMGNWLIIKERNRRERHQPQGLMELPYAGPHPITEPREKREGRMTRPTENPTENLLSKERAQWERKALGA